MIETAENHILQLLRNREYLTGRLDRDEISTPVQGRRMNAELAAIEFALGVIEDAMPSEHAAAIDRFDRHAAKYAARGQS